MLKNAKKATLTFARSIINEEITILDTIECNDGWIFFIDGWLVPRYGVLYSFMNCPKIFVYDKKSRRIEYVCYSKLKFGKNHSNTFFEAVAIYFRMYSQNHSVDMRFTKESEQQLVLKLLDAENKKKSLIGTTLFKLSNLKRLIFNHGFK